MGTETQWKDKYFDALEETENVEKQLKDAEDLLRLTVSRLTAVGSCSDQTLDEQFGKLRKLTRRAPDNKAIRSLLDQISVTIKRIDIELNAGQSHRLPANQVLALVARKVDFPLPLRKKARSLENKLGKDSSLAKLDKLLPEFLTLINKAMELELENNDKKNEKARQQSVESDADNTKDKNNPDLAEEILQQIRERFSQDNTITKTINTLRSSNTQRELQTTASKLISLVSSQTSTTKTSANDISPTPTPMRPMSKDGETESATNTRFSEFLDMLPIGEEFRNQTNSIKVQLAGQLEPSDWPPLMRKIADIISAMRSKLENERAELQQFLLELTNQLQTIDQSLVKSEQSQNASYQSSTALDEALRANLSELQTSVDNESDLGNLRAVINQRMTKINEHLQQYHEEEAQRQEALSAEMQILRTQVQSMESETTELNEKLQVEREQARTDPLTSLCNRVSYEQRLDEEYARWQDGDIGLSIIVCDVDRFKQLNDNLGHQAGDKALQSIATVLKANIRKGDLLARYGGEEFVVLISHDKDDSDTIGKIAEQLRAEVESAEFKFKGEPVSVTLSCGYSSFKEGDGRETAFSRADKNLYRAKESGRNRVQGDTD